MKMKINKNKCRVCLENVGVIPFFQEHANEIVSEMISSLFNIDVMHDESLPTTICSNCLENIKLCLLTKTIIVNSESMLSLYLKSNTIIEESEENLNQAKVQDEEEPTAIPELNGLEYDGIIIETSDEDSSRDSEDEQPAGLQIINVQSLTTSNPQMDPTASVLYDCGFCDFKAVTYKRLMFHKQMHSDSYLAAIRTNEAKPKERKPKGGKQYPGRPMSKRVTCKICGKKLSIFSIKRHIRSTHYGEEPFSCSFCDKSFTRYDNLNNHMKIHFNPNLNPKVSET